MVGAFFSWWYGLGWKQVYNSLNPRLSSVAQAFSTRQLARTLFAPWRRIITPPGRSLDAKIRAAIDNLFSRAIGFVVRAGVLLTAAIALLGTGFVTLIELIIWPLLPPAIPLLLILGVIG